MQAVCLGAKAHAGVSGFMACNIHAEVSRSGLTGLEGNTAPWQSQIGIQDCAEGTWGFPLNMLMSYTAGQSDSGGTSGPLQEAAERTSSAEGSLSQAGQPTMPRRGARSLSVGQLDGLMGQLAAMSDDKSRKDLLGEPTPLICPGCCLLSMPSAWADQCM